MFTKEPIKCLYSSQEIKQWYESHYYLLSWAGLWLKGGEPNTMSPAMFYQAELRFLVCRLSTYRDVAASISHALVGQIVGEVENVCADFAFLPPPKDIRIMTESKIPLWVGTTTKEPPRAFDILGISNSFVLELLNLPKLLLFSGIPLFKTERMKMPDIPLIIIGGANAAVTSVLHGPINGQGYGNNHGLVDAVLVGEGEFAIKQFLEIVKKGKASGLNKSDILKECHGKVDGFYEPDKYEHKYKTVVQNLSVRRENTEDFLWEITPKVPYVSFPVKSAIVYDLDQARTLESGPIWYDMENLGKGSLQISNGCPCFCTFCAESWERKPYRERSLSKLMEGLKTAKPRQGLDTVNFMSFNFNTHTELYPLILSFYKEIAHLSLKSERFDFLSADRFLADVQHIIGKTSVSCGMEGISERLRRYLHKNLSDEQIYQACEYLMERGTRELKIFLISTGLEEEEDFAEFKKFVKSLADLRDMSKKKTRIIFSITRLYYPPHTPLQFHECNTSITNNKNIAKELEKICRSKGMEFRESASYEETWLMQLLAMGDRRLTPALLRSSLTDDFLYYNTVPGQVQRNWRTYLKELGLSEEYYFQKKGKDQTLPWDDIDTGISGKFLWEEYERSVHFKEREYCLGRPYMNAKCLGCGACPTPGYIKKITQHKIIPPFFPEELKHISKNKQNKLVLRIAGEIEPEMRLIPKKFFGVYLARAIMLTIPELVPYYHSQEGHLRDFTEEKVTTDFAYGINAYNLSFLTNDTLKELLENNAFAQRIPKIQEHCNGFKIHECKLDQFNTPEVKYVLYKFYFVDDFGEYFIEQKVGRYLHNSYVRHTLFKKEDCSIFRVNEKNKKNSVVLYARIDRHGSVENGKKHFKLIMLVTSRFGIRPFLEACYGTERKREIICTKIESLGYYGKEDELTNKKKCIVCNNEIHEVHITGKASKENHCLVCSIDGDTV